MDDKGVRVTARTPLTLEASAGRWNVRDFNETQPGVQVFIEGGQARFRDSFRRSSRAKAPSKSQRASSPPTRNWRSCRICAPSWRRAFLKVNSASKPRAATALPIAAFERELQSITGNGGGRAAGYVKGRMQGKYLLSMRFDSQSDEDNRLFRDIQPDEFYPVYGDSSTKGFDAQSTGKLYIRVG